MPYHDVIRTYYKAWTMIDYKDKSINCYNQMDQIILR